MAISPSLVVLAAGMGSRYGGLKQIDGIGPSGETLLEYSIYDALKSGFGKIVFIIRKDIEQDFKEVILKRLPATIRYEIAHQEIATLPDGLTAPADRTKPWGTAHALWCAKEHLDTPFAVINADDFYGREAFSALQQWLTTHTNTSDSCMVGYALQHTLSEEGAVSRGVCRTDAEGCLTSIVEHTHITRTPQGIVNHPPQEAPATLAPDTVVSMNCWGFQPSFLTHLDAFVVQYLRQNIDSPKGECYIPAAVADAIQKHTTRCHVLHSDAQWCGITYPGDRPRLQLALEQKVHMHIYPPSLW